MSNIARFFCFRNGGASVCTMVDGATLDDWTVLLQTKTAKGHWREASIVNPGQPHRVMLMRGLPPIGSCRWLYTLVYCLLGA